MMNIGYNPTVSDNPVDKTVETNFSNFEGDLYGENLKIELLHRIRDEMKFNSVEELKLAMENDKKISKDYIDSL